MKKLIQKTSDHLRWKSGECRCEDRPIHDYFTHRGWGHDYSIYNIVDGGKEIHATGHGLGIAVGDIIKMQQSKTEPTHYVVGEIEYYQDPTDMWNATLYFHGAACPQKAIRSIK